MSPQTLASTTKEIEKARQMIAKAQTVLSKAEPVQRDETNKLEQLTARSIRVQKLEAEKGTELEAARARLAEVISVGREELRPQAIVKVEENKRNKLSALETKL